MCLKDDANSHLSGSLWDGAQQPRNCSRIYGGMCVIGYSYRILTWTPGWEPAVITTDWDPAECDSP